MILGEDTGRLLEFFSKKIFIFSAGGARDHRRGARAVRAASGRPLGPLRAAPDAVSPSRALERFSKMKLLALNRNTNWNFLSTGNAKPKMNFLQGAKSTYSPLNQ